MWKTMRIAIFDTELDQKNHTRYPCPEEKTVPVNIFLTGFDISNLMESVCIPRYCGPSAVATAEIIILNSIRAARSASYFKEEEL